MTENEETGRSRDEVLTDFVVFASRVVGCAASAAAGVQWTSKIGVLGLIGFPLGFVGGFCVSLATLSLLVGAVIAPERREEDP